MSLSVLNCTPHTTPAQVSVQDANSQKKSLFAICRQTALRRRGHDECGSKLKRAAVKEGETNSKCGDCCT